MKCKIADFTVEFHNRGKVVDRLCEAYAADFDRPNLTVEISKADIEAERGVSDQPFSNAYLESVCAYRNLCVQLPAFDAFLLHGAVIRVENRGVAFVARSGTGKTTHMLYWKQLLGDEMKIINGDKPIIRYFDGVPYAYGTPWCGKEGYSLNERVELTDICLIERSPVNETVSLPKEDAIMFLIQQVLHLTDREAADKQLTLLDRTIERCNIWKIKCNLDPDSAKIAYNTIFGK